jgi:hypothetical protein
VRFASRHREKAETMTSLQRVRPLAATAQTRRGSKASISIACSALLLTGSAAFADDPPPLLVKAPSAAQTEASSEPVSSVYALTALDVTTIGDVFQYSEVTVAPLGGNIEESGIRLRAFEGYGIYKVPLDGGQSGYVRGSVTDGSLLLGYDFARDNYSLGLFAGLDVQNNWLAASDPQDAAQGTQLGAKGVAELWWTPTPQTLVFGLAEYSTAFQTYFTQAKLGYDVLSGKAPGKEIFIGPEFIALGDERFAQQRVGIHVTAIHMRSLNIEISGGYVHDDTLGSGAYSIVELNTKF